MPTPSFAYPTDTAGQALNTVYAEHNSQYGKAFSAQLDAGLMSLLGPVQAPTSAPSVTLSAGNLNGSYQWGTYWITGIPDGTGNYNVTGRTLPSPYNAAQTLANQESTVSIAGQTIPAVVIGWGVVRNKSGGTTWYEVPGSEQFLNGAGSMPASFVDNTADANLVTAAPSTNTTGTSLSGNIDAKTLSGLQQADIIMGKVSPNLITNAGFESVSSTATVFSDALTSYTGTFNTGDKMGPWDIQAGSVTGGASGVTCESSSTEISAGNAEWKPIVASDGTTKLALTSQVTVTTPATLSTSNNGVAKLRVGQNDWYQARIDNATFYLEKGVTGSGYSLLASTAHSISASTTYTLQLLLDSSGGLTANLYNGTGGSPVATLTKADTSLTSGFEQSIGGDTGVVMSSASVTAPWADGWTIVGDSRVAWALNSDAPISGKFSPTGKGVANGVLGFLRQSGIAVTSGATYTASMYAKSDSVGSGTSYMQIDNFTTNQTSKITGTTSEQRYELTSTTTSTSVNVDLVINDSGTVTFDNIQLEEGSTATPYIPPVQTVQTPIALPGGSSVNEGWKLGTRYQLPDYDYTASSLGRKDVYTVLTFTRPNGTTYMVSTLSNLDANNNYQTDTWQFYDSSGNVTETHVWSLTYDSNSVLYKAVRTS